MKRLLMLMILSLVTVGLVSCRPNRKPKKPGIPNESVEKMSLKSVYLNDNDVSESSKVTEVNTNNVLISLVLEVPEYIKGIKSVTTSAFGERKKTEGEDLTIKELGENTFEVEFELEFWRVFETFEIKLLEVELLDDYGHKSTNEVNKTLKLKKEKEILDGGIISFRIDNKKESEEIWSIGESEFEVTIRFDNLLNDQGWYKRIESVNYSLDGVVYSKDIDLIMNTTDFKFSSDELDGKGKFELISVILDEGNGNSREIFYNLEKELNIYGGVMPAPIPTKIELSDIGAHNDKNFILDENVDLKGRGLKELFSQDLPFEGTFDGNGKTISNVNVLPQSTTGTLFNTSLFGHLNGSTIKNLNLNSVSVNHKMMNDNLVNLNAGILASVANGENNIDNVTIDNSFIDIDKTIKKESLRGHKLNIGGLIGLNNGDLSLKNINLNNSRIVSSDFYNKDKSVTNIGGFIGGNSGELTILNGSMNSEISVYVDIYNDIELNAGAVIGVNNSSSDTAIEGLKVDGLASIGRLRHFREDQFVEGVRWSKDEMFATALFNALGLLSEGGERRVQSFVNIMFKDFNIPRPMKTSEFIFSDNFQRKLKETNIMSYGGLIGNQLGNVSYIKDTIIENNLDWNHILGFETVNVSGVFGSISDDAVINSAENSNVITKGNVRVDIVDNFGHISPKNVSRRGNFGFASVINEIEVVGSEASYKVIDLYNNAED